MGDPGSGSPDAPAGEAPILVGLLAAPGLTQELAEELAAELPALLRKRFPEVEWQIAVQIEPLARAGRLRRGPRPGGAPTTAHGKVKLVVCLTDLPLHLGRRPVTAYASAALGVGLVSVPALGVVAVEGRARRAVVRLIEGLLGESVAGRDRAGGDGGRTARMRRRLRERPVWLSRPWERDLDPSELGGAAMSQSRDRSGPWSDTGRGEAFSDAVLAIVITLLVLDLQPPEHRPGQLLTVLLDQWPTYLAYLTSFLYVGVVWLNHKAAFNRISEMDRGLHWANLAILLTTSLLPFPTAVIADAVEAGDSADVRAAVGLYALVGVLVCVSWWWFFHYLGRHPELTKEDVHDRFFPRERIRALVGMLLYAAAGVIGGLVAPPLALVAFFALAVFYGVTSHGLSELPVVSRRGSAGG